MDEYPYKVINSAGVQVLEARESCRHSKKVEMDHLEAGYTIMLHGKRITKKECSSRAR